MGCDSGPTGSRSIFDKVTLGIEKFHGETYLNGISENLRMHLIAELVECGKL